MRAWGEAMMRNPGRRDNGWGSHVSSGFFSGLTRGRTRKGFLEGVWELGRTFWVRLRSDNKVEVKAEVHCRMVEKRLKPPYPRLSDIRIRLRIFLTFRNKTNSTIVSTLRSDYSGVQRWESSLKLSFFVLYTTTRLSLFCVYNEINIMNAFKERSFRNCVPLSPYLNYHVSQAFHPTFDLVGPPVVWTGLF